MKDLNIVVAMTKDRVIGNKGALPWKIPQELALFKELTRDNIVVMGRNTYFSIGHALEDRINIVVSRIMKPSEHIYDVIVAWDINMALERCREYDKRVFFIGGMSIYQDALQLVDNLYISWIKKDYVGDTLFPEINFNEWLLTKEQDYEEFIRKEYRRIKCS